MEKTKFKDSIREGLEETLTVHRAKIRLGIQPLSRFAGAWWRRSA